MFASGYVPGAVSSLLATAPEVSASVSEKSSSLADLFTLTPDCAFASINKRKAAQSGEIQTDDNDDTSLPAKKKKKKQTDGADEIVQNTEKSKKSKKKKNETPLSDDDEPKLKRPKRRSKEKENRTIFVGNVNVNSTTKTLKRFFKQYGEVENVRFRSAAPADPKIPKKAIVATKDFHTSCNNINAYIVFTEVESAKQALVANGEVFEGLTLRVDLSTKSKEHNHNCSVFVGNLPFDIEEEVLRKHFTECGSIVDIRLIKDKRTRIGKGFGYILFEDKDAVHFALQLDGRELSSRKLRIQRSTSTPSRAQHTGLKAQSRGQPVPLTAGARRKTDKPNDKTKPKIKKPRHNRESRTPEQSSQPSPVKPPKKKETKEVKEPAQHVAISSKSKKFLAPGKSVPSNASRKDYQGIQARNLQKIKKKLKVKKKRLNSSDKSEKKKWKKPNKADNARKRMRKKVAKSTAE